MKVISFLSRLMLIVTLAVIWIRAVVDLDNYEECIPDGSDKCDYCPFPCEYRDGGA